MFTSAQKEGASQPPRLPDHNLKTRFGFLIFLIFFTSLCLKRRLFTSLCLMRCFAFASLAIFSLKPPWIVFFALCTFLMILWTAVFALCTFFLMAVWKAIFALCTIFFIAIFAWCIVFLVMMCLCFFSLNFFS